MAVPYVTLLPGFMNLNISEYKRVNGVGAAETALKERVYSQRNLLRADDWQSRAGCHSGTRFVC